MSKISLGAVFLALLLSLQLTAAPARVGLVRVEQGKVTLNGKTVSGPQLAEQGSTLKLENGASVRIQLLGGGGEVTLRGPLTTSIDRASLAKQAKTVVRGGISMVPDIGNTTRGATSTTREVNRPHKRDFQILVPPKLEGDEWVFTVLSGPNFAPDSYQVEWGITSLSPQNSEANDNDLEQRTFERTYVHHADYDKKLADIRLKKDRLLPGVRYLLAVDFYDNGHFQRSLSHELPFRILMGDEEAYLAENETLLRQSAKELDSALPLLELASLYLEWDQLLQARNVFLEAKQHPNWERLETPVKEKAEIFQRQIDVIWDVVPSSVSSHKQGKS